MGFRTQRCTTVGLRGSGSSASLVPRRPSLPAHPGTHGHLKESSVVQGDINISWAVMSWVCVCFCGFHCCVRQVLGVFFFLLTIFLILCVASFYIVSFFLFLPMFFLFVPPVSPRLSPPTVGVLQKGTLGRRMQGRGLGAVIKGFVTRCTFLKRERGFDIITKKGTDEWVFLFAPQRVWRVRCNFFF